MLSDLHRGEFSRSVKEWQQFATACNGRKCYPVFVKILAGKPASFRFCRPCVDAILRLPPSQTRTRDHEPDSTPLRIGHCAAFNGRYPSSHCLQRVRLEATIA